jgi:transcriptional regulator with XRE-family HTH domain
MEETFGQRVKARRRELDLTQEELARRVGCAPVTLRKIEYDDLRPSVQIAERLALALNIPPEEHAAFVRQARAERAPVAELSPTPAPRSEEIGADDLSERAIRGYALGERVGTGGMGVVYRAVQPLVQREVAIKIILPRYANHPDFIRRFEAEAQLVARQELPRFAHRHSSINGVAFSPDGQELATADLQDELRIWDIGARQVKQVITGAGLVNYALKYSPDGKYLLTGNQGEVATLWDAQTGQAVHQYRLTGISIQDIAFSPDGKYALAGGFGDGGANSAAILDIAAATEVTRFMPVGMYGVDFSPGGQYVLTANSDGVSRVWSLATRQVVSSLGGSARALDVGRFSPDGKTVLTAGDDTIARLWDIQTHQEIRRFVGHIDGIMHAAFSPDGKYAATASLDGTARLWDVGTGRELRRFIGHTAGVENVAFSPDGKLLATVGDDATARLWDVDYHDTLRYLCGRLTRDLTDDERQQYNIPNDGPTFPKP